MLLMGLYHIQTYGQCTALYQHPEKMQYQKTNKKIERYNDTNIT